VTKAIKHGAFDGLPCRWTLDPPEAWMLTRGSWRKTSITDVVTTAAVLTEQEYLRNFGHRHLPPLPDAAFCDGWRGPLV
jgi:hypothetical protein